jgi:capping protein beta
MRRMPPSASENSLAGLIALQPELTDDLLTNVDQPLKTEKDTKTGKMFVLCDYNRDGDSYRSPWSNEYFPPLEDGFTPSKKLRELEVEANGLVDVYRKLYFDSGYSSAYFFQTDEKSDENFGACFLIHKDIEEGGKGMEKAWWNSTHVFEVSKDAGKKYTYKLTTTVMISMKLVTDKIGNVDLSGLRNQQASKTVEVNAEHGHVANMGKMAEEMDTMLRNKIVAIYIDKGRAVISGIRSNTAGRDAQFADISKQLNLSFAKKA